MGLLTNLITWVTIAISVVCAKTPQEKRLKKIQENKENLRAFWLALILIWSTYILFLIKGFVPWFLEGEGFARIVFLMASISGGFLVFGLSAVLWIRMKKMRAEIRELKREKEV